MDQGGGSTVEAEHPPPSHIRTLLAVGLVVTLRALLA